MGDIINRKKFSATLDKEILEKAKQLSKETRIPLSRLLDEALELLLKEHGK